MCSFLIFFIVRRKRGEVPESPDDVIIMVIPTDFLESEDTYFDSPYQHDNFQNSRNRDTTSHNEFNDNTKNFYECADCGKKSHTAEKPYHCNDCGKSFVCKAYLQTHQKIHARVKPYCCSECGKTFTHKSYLHQYQRIHTGEKLYCCNDCGQAFVCKAYLQTHQKTHSGEKPHCCTECGTRFIHKRHFLEHLKKHSEDKPFNKTALQHHQRCHTGEKAFFCKECGKVIAYKSEIPQANSHWGVAALLYGMWEELHSGHFVAKIVGRPSSTAGTFNTTWKFTPGRSRTPVFIVGRNLHTSVIFGDIRSSTRERISSSA
uniref:C2H2-type domain-containing protein n=1 Tax=Erpetoichthys calabaricus TaxID=27687 RepID=A0A8C4T4V5_ERPCA